MVIYFISMTLLKELLRYVVCVLEYFLTYFQDIANPLLRPYMQFYPEDGEGGMSQLWHGAKWLKDIPDKFLTPMAIHPVNAQHFYVREVCQCTDGTLFLPLRWYQKPDKSLWGTGFPVIWTQV